jgi:hypothetical protein
MPESTTRLEPAEIGVMEPRDEIRGIGLHALAAAVMYITPLLLFVPAAFITAGMRFGSRGLLYAIGGAALLLLAFAFILGGLSVSTGEASGVARLIFTIGVPAWIATGMIVRQDGIGRVLTFAVASSTAGFVLVELLMRAAVGYSPYGTVAGAFRDAGAPTVEMYRRMGISGEGLDSVERFSNAIASTFVPSLLLIITATMFLFSIVMLSRLPWGQRGAANLLFRGFRLPDWVLFGFVAGGIAPFLSGVPRLIGLNLLVVVIFLYLVQGFAVFRGVTLRMQFGVMGNVLAWMLLAFMVVNGIGIFLLFVAGLFDPFFDFRNYKRKGENNESNTD